MSSDSLRLRHNLIPPVAIHHPESTQKPTPAKPEIRSQFPEDPKPLKDTKPNPKNLWKFFTGTLDSLPSQNRSDLKVAMSQLREQLPDTDSKKLSGQVKLLGYLEGVEAWVDTIESLDLPVVLKTNTIGWVISGALTGKENWIRQGMELGQELHAYSRLKAQRDQIQKLFANIFPTDIRLGRHEAKYKAENAFLRSLDEANPEVRKHIRLLLQEGHQEPEPKTRAQVQQQIKQWQTLYQSEHLQTFLESYETTQRTLLKNNPQQQHRILLEHALGRMDRYETDLEVINDFKELAFLDAELNTASLLAAGKTYRDELLESAEAIETELAAALDLAELEQEAARWEQIEASQALEEGEPDEPQAETKAPDNEEVAQLRVDLIHFQALRQEIEAIDFNSSADLAQSLTELEAAAPEYFSYETHWVHQEIIDKAEAVLRLNRRHAQSQKLLAQTEALLVQTNPSTQDYRTILDTIGTAALWTTVEARIAQYGEMHQSAWLTDGIIAAVQEVGESAFVLTPLVSLLDQTAAEKHPVDGASPYAQMESEYLQVLALLTQGKADEARRRFVRLETSNEHAHLVENFKDSQTFNQCSLNAGIVIASAGIGEIFAVAAVRAATAMNVTRGLSAVRFTTNAATFTGVSHGFTQASMGKDYFDPRRSALGNVTALSEEFVLNMGMFYFLGRSQKLFQTYANRALVKLAERRIAQSALGKSMVSSEAQGALNAEFAALGNSGLVRGGMKLGSFATELAGFGAWDYIHMNYEDLKSGHFNPIRNVESSILNPEAWKERFVFLIALKAGGVLVSPITKPLHRSVEQWALEGHREKLEAYQEGITEAQGALEKFLTHSQGDMEGFPHLVSAYRKALEKQANLLEAIPEYGNPQTQALNRAALRQLESFESGYLAHEKIFGVKNVFGIEIGVGGNATYTPRKVKKLRTALETYPDLQDLEVHDNGLIKFVFTDPITNQSNTLHLAPKGREALDLARENLQISIDAKANHPFKDGLKSFLNQMAVPMPFMVIGPHTLIGKLIHQALEPKNNNEDIKTPTSEQKNSDPLGEFPALLNGRRPVSLVRSGDYAFASDLSRWRFIGTEGSYILFELEPPPEGTTYSDRQFSGKPGNQKQLRVPFGATEFLSSGELWQIVSPRAVAQKASQAAKFNLRESPSGIHVEMEPGQDLVAIAKAVVVQEWNLVENCNSRVVLNTQAWAEPFTPSEKMISQLKNLAEEKGVTLAVKTAAPPYALEFEPAAEISRQKAQGPLEAIGMRVSMGMRLQRLPTLDFGRVASLLSGYYPWEQVYSGAQKHHYQKYGIEFDYAVVDYKDLPELAESSAAGISFHQINMILGPKFLDPKIKPEHRQTFQDLLAIHQHALDTLDGGYLKATKLELAVAQKEGLLLPYLEFLQRNNLLQNRGIDFGNYNRSIARDFEILQGSIADFFGPDFINIPAARNDPIFRLATQFKFPEDLIRGFGEVLEPDYAAEPYQLAAQWGEAVFLKEIGQYVRNLAGKLIDVATIEGNTDSSAINPRMNAAYALGIQPLLQLHAQGLLGDAVLRSGGISSTWARSMKYLTELLKNNFGIKMSKDFPLLGLVLGKQIRLLTYNNQKQPPIENKYFEATEENVLNYIVENYFQGDVNKISQSGRFIERSFTLPNGNRIKARQILENYFRARGKLDELSRLMKKPGGIREALIPLREYAEILSLPRKNAEISHLIRTLLGPTLSAHHQELIETISRQVHESKTFPLTECLRFLILMKGLAVKPEHQSRIFRNIIDRASHNPYP